MLNCKVKQTLATVSAGGGAGRRCSAGLTGRHKMEEAASFRQAGRPAGRHKLSWSISGMSVS